MSAELWAIIGVGITLIIGFISLAAFIYSIVNRAEDRLNERIDSLDIKCSQIEGRLNTMERQLAVFEKGLSTIEAFMARLPWYVGADLHDRKEK